MNTKVLAALSRTKKESATALQVPKQQHLCDNCSKLFLRPTIFADLATPRGVRHGLKPYDMVVNALAGCRICRELLCLAYKILRDRRTKDSDSSGIDEILRTWQENIEAANSTPTGWRRALPSKFLTSKRRVFDPDFRFSCNILQETDIKVACVGDKGRWSIAAANDDPAAKYVCTKLIDPNVKLERTFDNIRAWLKGCDPRHARCQVQEAEHFLNPNKTPAFLLDVAILGFNRNTIRLRRKPDTSLIYAALSYCWGTTQPSALRNANISTYLADGIRLETLPQSIKDAVEVTRKLQLRYLWVDALCIVQDDEHAKLVEIGKMDSIYRRAYITISASCAKTCLEGFLQDREPAKDDFGVAISCPNGETGVIRMDPGHYSRRHHEFEHPLEKRAWAFQEQFMSRRLLVFNKHQIVWGCVEKRGQDDGKEDQQRMFGHRFSSRTISSPTAGDWVSVVYQFSSKSLTDPMDKLPSISSIAEYFSKHKLGRYLAGLWEEKLPAWLCWSPHSERSTAIERPFEWRAPSWSFFSVDGVIIYRHSISNRYGKFSGPMIKMEDCTITPISESAPFAKLSAAELRIRGPLTEVRIARPRYGRFKSDRPKRAFGLLLYVEGDSERRFGDVTFDTLETSSELQYLLTVHSNHGELSVGCTTQLWCLPCLYSKSQTTRTTTYSTGLITKETETEWDFSGLILARLPNGKYHRIGLFSIWQESHPVFFKLPSQSITIV